MNIAWKMPLKMKNTHEGQPLTVVPLGLTKSVVTKDNRFLVRHDSSRICFGLG